MAGEPAFSADTVFETTVPRHIVLCFEGTTPTAFFSHIQIKESIMMTWTFLSKRAKPERSPGFCTV